jgi:hypothetical protein
VNFASSSKHCPYLPILPGDTASMQLDLLKTLGVNLVRLGVPWSAVAELTPSPPPGDSPAPLGTKGTTYLESLCGVIDELYQRDIFVLIDFHQDIAHELYGGDGFPDWAMAVDVDHPRPKAPPPADPSWALRDFELPDSLAWLPFAPKMPTVPLPGGGSVGINELVRNTLRSFWLNATKNERGTVNTRDQLTWTIQAVAAALSGHPAILGYEPFNEPHPAGLGKKCFEEKYLTPFYQAVVDGVHSVDPEAYLFCEPRVDWNIMPTKDGEEQDCPHDSQTPDLQMPILYALGTDTIKTFVWPTLPPASTRAVFAFHFYDPWTALWGIARLADDMSNKQQEWPGVFAKMLQAAQARSMIPFLTEFGGSYDWKMDSGLGPYQTQIQTYLDLMYQQIESTLLNSALWVYDLYYSKDHGDNWNDERFSLLGTDRQVQEGMKPIVARPYPMRSAALPTFLSFDSDTGQGVMAFAGTPPGAPPGAPSMLYVPRSIHYPDGFEVHATCNDSDHDLWWDEANQLLYWNLSAGRDDHSIIVCRPGALDIGAVPMPYRATAFLDPVTFPRT